MKALSGGMRFKTCPLEQRALPRNEAEGGELLSEDVTAPAKIHTHQKCAKRAPRAGSPWKGGYVFFTP